MPLKFNGARTETAPAPIRSSAAKSNEPQNFRITSPKYTFDDLILPTNVLDELKTVVEASQYWDTVFRQWDLRSVMKDRDNIFVDLYGDPGTGKTMANVKQLTWWKEWAKLQSRQAVIYAKDVLKTELSTFRTLDPFSDICWTDCLSTWEASSSKTTCTRL